MNNEEKILNLVEKMYTEFTGRFESIETRLTSVENTVTRIENNHGEKLSVLFDGYKQNSDKLDRIEKEVAKHEEVILRRIR